MATRAIGVRAQKGGKAARGVKVEDIRSRRYDPAETRLRVLEAAYALFSSRGYGGTGTADIAAMADVSEGSIFYHFGSKRALLIELGRLHGQKMIAAMQMDDPLEKLTFETTLARCFDFSELTKAFENEENEECPTIRTNGMKKDADSVPFFSAAKETVVDWSKRHLDAMVKAGRCEALDTEMASEFIFALVGQAVHAYIEPGISAEEKARIRAECIRFCMSACRMKSAEA